MVVTRTGVHTTSGLLTADFASGSHLLRPQFFGEGIGDREWFQDGAAVRVSMIGFDGGVETVRELSRNAASLPSACTLLALAK